MLKELGYSEGEKMLLKPVLLGESVLIFLFPLFEVEMLILECGCVAVRLSWRVNMD